MTKPLPESKFPTIRDVRDQLTTLVERGLGQLPAQIVVVPDSTIQAIALQMGADPKEGPALMIELREGRPPVSLISTERFTPGGGMKTRSAQ